MVWICAQISQVFQNISFLYIEKQHMAYQQLNILGQKLPSVNLH